MSISIIIHVPDIDNVIAAYDQIKVFRAENPIGPYQEITAAHETTATLLGRTAGPYFNYLSGKKLTIRKRDGLLQTVEFTTPNPVHIDDIVLACNDPVTGFSNIIAANVANRLELTTLNIGADELIQIVNSTAVDDLGFHAGEYDTGEYARINLVDGVTEYLFIDTNGNEGNFYKTTYYNTTTNDDSEESDVIKGSNPKVLPEKFAVAESAHGLTLFRGNVHTFRSSFFEDVDLTTPCTPIDLGKYPQVTIIDVNGQIISDGLAVLDGVSGYYRYEFHVPEDAVLSYDDRRWQCRWFMITNKHRQIENNVEFDVRDPDIAVNPLDGINGNSGNYLAMPCREFQVFLPLQSKPYSVSLDILVNGDNTKPLVLPAIYPFNSEEPTQGATPLTETVNGNYYIYSYTIPKGCEYLKECNYYTLLWSINKTLYSGTEFVYQTLDVPPMKLLKLMSSLRMLIDKRQKDKDLIQAYSDYELYEYLKRGRDIVNAYVPVTGWGFNNFPEPLLHYMLLGAVVWGLNAQHLLEVDLNFDFSGQTTVLSYDHTSGISEAYSRNLDLLKDTIQNAKTSYLRQTTPVGMVALRPYTYRRNDNWVFKLSATNGYSVLGVLNMIGLI